MKNNNMLFLILTSIVSLLIGFGFGKAYQEKKSNQDGFLIEGPGWKLELEKSKKELYK